MAFRFFTLFSLLLASLSHVSLGLDAAGWSQLSIYQLLTDRYATTNGSDPSCWIRAYCGGTWRGIINKLDYIQGMGFEAIWISPVVHQIEANTTYGFAWHGYWQNDPFRLNEHFGTPKDLKDLSDALHSRGMYLMLDVVTNHFASNSNATNVDYSQYPKPFNTPSAFHQPPCPIDYNNITSAQFCWEVYSPSPVLPDINTENDLVYDTLMGAIKHIVTTYKVDGIRLDSSQQVPPKYLAEFQNEMGIYVVGEIFNGDPAFVSTYQGPLNATLDYPLYFHVYPAFLAQTDFSPLALSMEQVRTDFPAWNLLGNFIDNHDNPRFASYPQYDVARAQNAAAYLLFTSGIPIIYYGYEQSFNGSGDPYNRETLWPYYDTSSPIYTYIAKLHQIRAFAAEAYGRTAYFETNAAVLMNDTNAMAIQRGPVTVVVSNEGGSGTSTTTLVTGTGLPGNTCIVDLLTCETADTDAQGNIESESTGGQARIWILHSEGGSFCK